MNNERIAIKILQLENKPKKSAGKGTKNLKVRAEDRVAGHKKFGNNKASRRVIIYKLSVAGLGCWLKEMGFFEGRHITEDRKSGPEETKMVSSTKLRRDDLFEAGRKNIPQFD
jgi:hypothetical protein